MKSTFLKKSAAAFFILALCTLFSFFTSCRKDINTDLPGIAEHLPDLSTTVSSSVSGFVTDENNAPVIAAVVKVGTMVTSTDSYGYFSVRNVQVVKEAAVVTVTYNGYFNGIKTYIAAEGKAAFFRIRLLPKTIAGTFDAATGGSVSLTNGSIVSLPANAVKLASGGALYSGMVQVALQYIDPTSTELIRIMPGDLRGVNTSGFIKRLISYGMLAVELTGDGGELLQIADEKKATITTAIPGATSSTAPASIPLWYFDERKGLWIEEGTATKSGNNYVGEVSHFSFWNCDQSSSYVHFDCTLYVSDAASRQPLAYTQVKISVADNPANFSYGITDDSGYVAGLVPDNTSLLFEVYGTFNCLNGSVYSQNFTTTNSALSLGDITVNNNASQSTAFINGTVTDCNNNPLTNGYVMATINADYSRISLNALGEYNFNTLLCSITATTISLLARDSAGGNQSTDTTVSVVPGTNAIGNIRACGNAFMNAVSNGYLYHPTSPRSISNFTKNLAMISPFVIRVDVGDLGSANFIADFTLDPVTNLIRIAAAPGAAGGVYVQFDTGLPSVNPGYTPQWTGSPQCNNTYDPVLKQYKVRYGYMGGTGYRVVEEIISVL